MINIITYIIITFIIIIQVILINSLVILIITKWTFPPILVIQHYINHRNYSIVGNSNLIKDINNLNLSFLKLLTYFVSGIKKEFLIFTYVFPKEFFDFI